MATIDLKKFLLSTSLMLSVAAFAAPQAYAQDTGTDPVETVEDDQEDVEEQDRIVVTGSRIERDTFTSIAPLQVISGDVSREAGLIDATSILQQSSATSGFQIDTTFQGFVLDNGPGATEVNLRGLGATRTLVLINGRRVSPAGIEGAPASPDISLLPSSLIERYDILLDGASSVYGSDAVAGVTNAIMRSDFDGFEFEAFGELPEGDGGESYTLSGSWGRNFDRGFIGVGAEFSKTEPVFLDDRDWTAGCDEYFEITTTGEIRNVGLTDNVNGNQRPDACKRPSLSGRIIELGAGYGSVYYTPGFTNTGIPNFSDSSFAGIPLPAGGTQSDINFVDYTENGKEPNYMLFNEEQTFSMMAYGEYNLDLGFNATPYFETIYSKRESFLDSGSSELFPVVPADNPFNPCNPNGLDGIDCGLAEQFVISDPTFRDLFAERNFSVCDQYGYTLAQCTPELFGYGRPTGAVDVQTVLNVSGDRHLTTAEIEQTRLVAGLRGDLPFINFGDFSNWSFDTFASYSQSVGKSARPGVREDRLLYSLETSRIDPTTGAIVCGDPGDNECVPINLFAPSLFGIATDGVAAGDFATQAERDYLFDVRDFDTEYWQTIVSVFASGDVYELPAGMVVAGLGLEYRLDEIDSRPDDVAREGLFPAFFSDSGAKGGKYTREAYGEIEIPVLANQPLATELNVNLSARWTDDEFYGSAWTYSGKFGYRPVDSLLLRGTIGTSFRAPNLRENFLLGQTGFLTINDPCTVPESLITTNIDGDPVFDPTAADNRDPDLIANCLASGVDPNTHRIESNGVSFYSVEISRGGATDLNEEESESYSLGFVFEQPFTDAFDLTFGVTHYNIEIENAIIEPSAQFLINDCYILQPGFTSAFCSRLERDPVTGNFSLIDGGFINQDEETAKGYDFNVNFGKEFTVFDRIIDFDADLRLNNQTERTTTFIDANGLSDVDTLQGEFRNPKWKGVLDLRADYDDYTFSWRTNYIGEVTPDTDIDYETFGNVFDGLGATCLGPDEGDVNCRPHFEGDAYFNHTLSVYYRGDTWTLGGGIRNIFDTEPPRIDTDIVFGRNNVPLGGGYDLQGRTFFLNIAKSLN